MKRLFHPVGIALILAGCVSSPRQPVPKSESKKLSSISRLNELPPMPPVGEVVVVPPAPEIPVAIGVGTPVGRIHKSGDMLAAHYDDKLLLWLDDGSYRELVLTNWNIRNGDSDFAISGTVLVLGRQGQWSPNEIHEFSLVDWEAGLPTRAVPVTQMEYSTRDGRGTAALATQAGGIVVATVRHTGGWQSDIAYRSPNGRWSVQVREYTPFDNIPSFQINIAQAEDGKICIVENKDSGGLIVQARWVERGDELVFVDFDTLIGPNGQLTPDYENPHVWLDWPLLAYQSAFESKPGCWFRLARNVVARVVVTPETPRPKINGFSADSVNYQNVHLTWDSEPGIIYRPEASTNLVDWKGIPAWDWNEVGGEVRFSGFNPYYSAASPYTQLYFSIRTLNWRVELVELLPEYVERALPSLKLAPKTDGTLDYFIAPMDEPDCPFDVWYLRTVGFPVVTSPPIDYRVICIGCGWAVIDRSGRYFLKKLE